jgi:hypothetical protein
MLVLTAAASVAAGGDIIGLDPGMVTEIGSSSLYHGRPLQGTQLLILWPQHLPTKLSIARSLIMLELVPRGTKKRT